MTLKPNCLSPYAKDEAKRKKKKEKLVVISVNIIIQYINILLYIT